MTRAETLYDRVQRRGRGDPRDALGGVAPHGRPHPRLGPRRLRRQARRTRSRSTTARSRGFPRSHVRRPRGPPRHRRARAASRCVAMQGRVHMYEGHSAATVAFPARVLVALGAQDPRSSRTPPAALNPTWQPGTLMLIRDHIDLLRDHALRGPNDDRLGPRFPDMTRRVRARAARARQARPRRDAGHRRSREGVYVAMPGPDVRDAGRGPACCRRSAPTRPACRRCPRSIVARHMGARVIGISCITNQAAGITGEELSHDEVTETATRVRATFEALLDAILARAGRDGQR